jgi:hypothetical protein
MKMTITITDVFKNGFWLTLPPLLLSLGLMRFLPTALTAEQFNQGMPQLLLIGENTMRIVMFALPAFFSIDLSTPLQRTGLIIYVLGVVLYSLSYLTQNFLPASAWSTSLIGFASTAYTNVIWLIGLGLLGEKFYFPDGLRYRPVYFIVPAVLFICLHVAHTVLYFQRTHGR